MTGGLSGCMLSCFSACCLFGSGPTSTQVRGRALGSGHEVDVDVDVDDRGRWVSAR